MFIEKQDINLLSSVGAVCVYFQPTYSHHISPRWGLYTRVPRFYKHSAPLGPTKTKSMLNARVAYVKLTPVQEKRSTN